MAGSDPQMMDVIRHLADVISRRREEIIDTWTQAVRVLPRASQLPEPALRDHIPDTLDCIASMAEAVARGETPSVPERVAACHAVSRLREGFDVQEVIAELRLLRHAIVEVAARAGLDPIVSAERYALHDMIDQIIAASVSRYSELRERTLRGFDLISSAGLQSVGLDELLQRLLRALHETTPVIDTSAIFILENGKLRLRAAHGIDRNAEENRLEIGIGEGFAGSVAAAAKTREIHLPDATTLKSEVLAAAGLKVLYGLPLLEGGQMIGVAEFGSKQVDTFSEPELRVIETMVVRASSVIRKQLLRDALAERQREFEAIAENIPQLTFIADRSGNATWTSRHWTTFTGLSATEIIGRLAEIVHPDHSERVMRKWKEARATGEPWDDTFPMRGANGYYRWFLTRAVPLHTSDGAVDRWFGTATDVTDRHFLDEATRILNSSLEYRETLDRLAHLVVPDLADWCIVDLVEGEQLEHVAIVHSDATKLALAHDYARRFPATGQHSPESWQVLATGETLLAPELTPEMLESPHRTREQVAILRELGFQSYLAAPIVARGRTIGVLHMITSTSGRRYRPADRELARDLGQRAGLAVENARLYRDAQDAVRVREDILAIVSHDLRNPLGAIDLGATLLASTCPPDPHVHKQIEAIKRSATRMERLISDLLDMASINAGKLAVQPMRLDAGELVDEVLDAQDPIAKQRGIAIVRENHLSGVPVLADKQRITQVFSNLLGNALKFCKEGDTIIVRGNRDGDRVQLAVADSGPGIPPDDLPHIFEPYWSGRSKKKPGTGLGLFISKAIVDAHHGDLSVVSAEGQGATFSVTLPVA